MKILFFFRRKQITAAVFSPDGSVLALAATTVITIWNPLTTELAFAFGKFRTVKTFYKQNKFESIFH